MHNNNNHRCIIDIEKMGERACRSLILACIKFSKNRQYTIGISEIRNLNCRHRQQQSSNVDIPSASMKREKGNSNMCQKENHQRWKETHLTPQGSNQPPWVFPRRKSIFLRYYSRHLLMSPMSYLYFHIITSTLAPWGSFESALEILPRGSKEITSKTIHRRRYAH